jgi:rhamnulokinase
VGSVKKEVINLAFDFGASSGRAIISKFDGEKIELEEIHRFANEPVKAGNHLYWDFLRLFYELKLGLKKAGAKYSNIASIGIDTWGVDYGFLDEKDNLISNPIHYRDSRTENMLSEIEKIVPYEEIYKETGIQYMALNTLYQLYADKLYRENVLKEAKSFLFIPDLFNFYLTGNKYNEYTIASTSQLINASNKAWISDILEKLGIGSEVFENIIKPGTICGTLTEDIQNELAIKKIPVVAVGSHDTASAVAGTPLKKEENNAYLSSGTWSLLGLEIDTPIINEASLKYNFTNEGGVEDTIRFLKNINGLWIIQQLRKGWSEKYGAVTFPDIIKEAEKAKNKAFIIDPNDDVFMAPLNMVEAIQNYCKEKGQGTPESLGDIAIAAYNGLTSEYKKVITILEEITGKTIEGINMVGGGIQDQFLCQLTADVTGKKVLAGPIEASVLGNIILQLMAIGEISSLKEGRLIIENSFEIKNYIPNN